MHWWLSAWDMHARKLGFLALACGAPWLLLWVGIPISAPDAPPRCLPVDGVVRGVTHVHPIGHDSLDRSEQVVSAAERGCLDFVVSTDHDARPARIFQLNSDVLILDGAEWNEDGHHHTQFVGAVQTDRRDVDNLQMGFRLLNHPGWSRIHSVADLSPVELDMLANGRMGIEILNTPRLLRHPGSWGPFVFALLVGPGREDLLVNAAMAPTPDQELWRELQTTLGKPVPFACGNDAHGRWLDYDVLFPSTVLHLAAPAAGALTAGYVVDQIRAGQILCVNEYLGSPGPVRVNQTGCALDVEADLPAGGHWRWVRGDDVLSDGSASATTRVTPGLVEFQLWRSTSFGIAGTHERLWALGPSFVIPAGCQAP